jgi:hypothetical protein
MKSEDEKLRRGEAAAAAAAGETVAYNRNVYASRRLGRR